MLQFRTLDQVNLDDLTVLVRADLNLPMQDGKVTDATRVERLAPTVKELLERGARVILMSHFGRPKRPNKHDSLKNILPVLTQYFGQTPLMAPDCMGNETIAMAAALKKGEILLLENLRFHKWEEMNGPHFANQLADLADIYVNDAFSCSHRAHASVVAITHFIPSYAGRGLQKELDALSRVMDHPKRPLMAIVAGSKVSTKLNLLGNLVRKVDKLVIGGGMANTFLKAQGHPIGQSLFESEMLETALAIFRKAASANCEIILPLDVVVTEEIKPDVSRRIVAVSDVKSNDIIVDLGDKTISFILERLKECATVVWNGPVGIFEMPPFDEGTTALAKAIAQLTAQDSLMSVAGGGDTLAALAHAGCSDAFSYTSTAGGAFLEWLEGKVLPGIEALEQASMR